MLYKYKKELGVELVFNNNLAMEVTAKYSASKDKLLQILAKITLLASFPVSTPSFFFLHAIQMRKRAGSGALRLNILQ